MKQTIGKRYYTLTDKFILIPSILIFCVLVWYLIIRFFIYIFGG